MTGSRGLKSASGIAPLLPYIIGLLFALAPEALAGDWPEFHGPRRDNKSDETGLLKSWPEDGPRLLWTATGLGKGYSSVSVAGGAIYTAGQIEGKTWVIALTADGQLKWKKPNGEPWKASPRRRYAASYAGARGTPTVHEGLVYHLGESGSLTAFKAADGSTAWKVNVLERFEGGRTKYGLSDSVLIDGDNLICSPGGSKGYIVALKKKTGETVWACTEVKDPVGYCSPVLAEFGGVRQILTVSARVLLAVDAATGKLLWSVPFQNQRNNNCTDPIFKDGKVAIATGYGKGSMLVELKKTTEGISAAKVWESKLLDNHHGGVILHEGHLYGYGHNKKGLTCLEFATGKEKFRAGGKGSLTFAEGMLYCLDERGTMSLVRPSPGKHDVVSSFKVPSGGSGLYWAHPVICGGRLYVRHADKLHAYDISAKGK
ncbi:MAG: outer membrane protein assembly factor BamB family protein [Planctomycetota bacterium]